MGRSPSRLALLLTPLVFACFALSESVQAVVPPPDGGYPNFTTAEGTNALQSLTTGSANTAVGWYSLFSDTTGGFNTGVGAGALALNNAENNTAIGVAALLFNTTGTENTANGTAALEFNETGSTNTANGAFALFSNTTGSENTAIGDSALSRNTTGIQNTASGSMALISNTTGIQNTAYGYQALLSNTTGSQNTANGFDALANNTTGNNNTAVGIAALLQNTTGTSNIALGVGAGSLLTTGNNNIDIGNGGIPAEANTIRIGQQGTQTTTYIAGISGATASGGMAVFVNADGQLGTLTSSARFKEAIKSMDNASEALFSLKPVTFRYKKAIDPKSTAQFGLVAEDVEKVNGDLVVRDAEGKVYSVRYDAVNAMLLNEFLKEHTTVQDQGATIAELKKEIAALAAGLEKVSAQFESSKTAPQVVNNP
jgi:Chaperone of endosialidase